MGSLKVPFVALLLLGLGVGVARPATAEWFDCIIPPPEDVEQESEEFWNNITWAPPILKEAWDIVAYNIYRAVWSDVIMEGYTFINETDPDTLLYTDFDITPGITYSYIVTAVGGGCGEGIPSLPTMPPYPHCEVVDMYEDQNETLGFRVVPQPQCLTPLPPLPTNSTYHIHIGIDPPPQLPGGRGP